MESVTRNALQESGMNASGLGSRVRVQVGP